MTSTEPTEDDRAVARAVAAAFGGRPRIRRYADDPGTRHVDILRADDRPEPGVTSWSTVGLSNAPLFQDGRPLEVRAELVAACSADAEEVGNVLATCAFNVMKDRWPLAPGVVHRDVFAMYRPGSPMRHVLFVPPFLWEPGLATLRLPSRTVAWLLAVPISDAEHAFAERNGSGRLESLFEERQIDVFDPERPSVL